MFMDPTPRTPHPQSSVRVQAATTQSSARPSHTCKINIHRYMTIVDLENFTYVSSKWS